MEWQLRSHKMDLDSHAVMGILNITPDSFSDGGRFVDPHKALEQALKLADEGARILDVGAESTRPDATPLDPEEEWQRLHPVLQLLTKRLSTPLSVDTRHGLTARRAIKFGVEIINDVSMGQDADLISVVRDSGVGYVLMHMRGNPKTMMELTNYKSVVNDIKLELQQAYQKILSQGVSASQICIDPGFGFAKTPAQNAELLFHLSEVGIPNQPLMVGLSRKRMLRECVGPDPVKLQAASVAACLLAAGQGANIFRVHDVAATVQALRLDEILTKAGPQGEEA